MLFPGEYNQYLGMLADCRDMPEVKEMLRLATKCFGFDVLNMMGEGDPELMAQVGYSQMLMYVANCAAWELLKREKPKLVELPHSVAGFSVGEYSALVAAGVMTFDQGLIIVKARADALQRWTAELEMRAIGIFGIEEADVEYLQEEARAGDAADGTEDPQIYISHYWGNHAFACSGRRSTVEKLQFIASNFEGVFVHLLEHTLDASHTPMASDIADEVGDAIAAIPFEPPQCEVFFNTGYRLPRDGDPLLIEWYLTEQLREPVRWNGIVHDCVQRGVDHFFEIGPGDSLKELMAFNVFEDGHLQRRPYDATKNVSV